MTELELYKFINENSINWHWQDNDGMPDVLIFPYLFQLDDFCEMLGDGVFNEEGIQIVLKKDYACIWMNDVCEYHGIDINKIFEKEN